MSAFFIYMYGTSAETLGRSNIVTACIGPELIDGGTVLSAWCKDAADIYRKEEYTLGKPKVIQFLLALLKTPLR